MSSPTRSTSGRAFFTGIDPQKLVLPGIIALIAVVTGLIEPRYWTAQNLVNLGRQIAPLLLLAAGQSLTVIAGGLDLSVAAVLALSGICGVFVMNEFGMTAGILAMLLTGLVFGAMNGAIIARFKGVPLHRDARHPVDRARPRPDGLWRAADLRHARRVRGHLRVRNRAGRAGGRGDRAGHRLGVQLRPALHDPRPLHLRDRVEHRFGLLFGRPCRGLYGPDLRPLRHDRRYRRRGPHLLCRRRPAARGAGGWNSRRWPRWWSAESL